MNKEIYKESIVINKDNIKEIEENLSDNKQFTILFKKVKKKTDLLSFAKKSIEELSDFKEPIVIFGRKNGHWEFHENCTMGWFTFTHSDGTQRAIHLSGRPDYIDYANKSIRTYFLHEDIGVKLPEDPITSSEFILEMESKMQSDRLKLESNMKSQNIKAWKEILKTLGYIILGFIGLMILARVMGIDVTTLNPFVKEVVKNISVSNTKPII